MTATHDRLLELLTDRALVGLGQREQIELAELLVKVQDVDIAAFDKAAAAIALATLGPLEPMPAALANRIEQAALDAPVRPASDYTTTRQLDKLAPGLVMTQVDEIIDPDPVEPESSQQASSLDFKKTLVVDERSAQRPGMLTQEPESIPTIARPNDPYLKQIQTTPRPFAPVPVPQPTPLVPPPRASSPAQPAASPYPSAPALSAAAVHSSAPAPRAYPPHSSGPMPAPYSRDARDARDPRAAAPSLANVVPFVAPGMRAPSRAFALAGWLAAAACLLLAIGAFVLRSTTPGPVATLPTATATATTATPGPSATASVQVAALTPAELRDKLLAAEGTARAEWAPTKDPLGKAATGEVVWNKDQQKGTMRFRGLAKNDPARGQYQLWIFDKTRDEKYPVDGGVFDVDSDTGDVIVPIHATLPVNAPVLFAVTLERPGGVVVSKRDRIVVTAKLPTG
jgi:hypothetical protein